MKIKSIRELQLMREKQKYKVLYLEKQLTDEAGELMTDILDKLKVVAFETGLNLVMNLIHKYRRKTPD